MAEETNFKSRGLQSTLRTIFASNRMGGSLFRQHPSTQWAMLNARSEEEDVAALKVNEIYCVAIFLKRLTTT